MSNALVDNIGNASGSLTTPTQYVVRGSAKAWANLNGTGTIALRDSLNVSSVVDNGTGDYTYNYTSAFSGFVGVNGSGGDNSINVTIFGVGNLLTTSCDIVCRNGSNSASDRVIAVVSTFGDLA